MNLIHLESVNPEQHLKIENIERDWPINLHYNINPLNKEIANEVDVACLIEPRLVSQPPCNQRKSNFFNFTFQLLDKNETPISVEKCTFFNFCDNIENNGIIYKSQLRLPDGTNRAQLLYITMIDASSEQLIQSDDTFDSGSENQHQQRVLLTHKAACKRCLLGKVCGSDLDNPTNPIISQDKTRITVFLRCTLSCTSGPGKTTSPRRFKIAISLAPDEIRRRCLSTEIFMHSNSKHTKSKAYQQLRQDSVITNPKNYPKIIAVSPSEGWTNGGQTVIIIGDNFRKGLHVLFGEIPVSCQLISEHAARVQSPSSCTPGQVSVTLALDNHQFCVESPGYFTFVSPQSLGLELGFSRLGRLVPRYPNDPQRLSKEELLSRAADILESSQKKYSVIVNLKKTEDTLLSEDTNATDYLDKILQAETLEA